MGTPRKKPIKARKPPPPPTPKQPKPWDVRPFPKKGEWAPSRLHVCVGRCLDHWGDVESFLGSVFAAFIGTDDGLHGALRAFGSVITFKGRAEMLAAAAEVYYAEFPDSKTKDDFKAIMEASQGFAARRNEIAHGITAPYGWFVPGRTLNRYLLGPSFFTTNKRSLAKRDHPTSAYYLKPTYLYSAVEINYFTEEIKKLAKTTAALFEAVGAEKAKRQKSSLQKSDEPRQGQ